MYDVVANEVFPFIKNLHTNKDSAYAKYMGDAIFKIPTPLMLSKIIDGIDNIDMDENKDTKGDLYEYLLSKVATAGTNGQFRTPRHIIDMIVRLMKPMPEDVIVDPAAINTLFPIFNGATKLVLHPINTLSPIIVLCLYFPS